MKKDLGAKALLFPTPVLVVATYNTEGKPNAMTASWGGICCSVPPCISVSLRKATYSYNNIMETRAFTINIPSEEYVVQVDYLGIATGRTEDKLEKAGFTVVKSELVNAPYVEEFAVNLECKVVSITELGLHTQFVGEVLNVKIDDNIDEKNIIKQLNPFIYSPDNHNYYGLGKYLGVSHSVGKTL